MLDTNPTLEVQFIQASFFVRFFRLCVSHTIVRTADKSQHPPSLNVYGRVNDDYARHVVVVFVFVFVWVHGACWPALAQ